MDAPWRLVPVPDAGPPPGAADARARGWFRGLVARLRSGEPAPSDVGPSDDALRPIEQARLERLAPPPPLAAQHAALDVWRGRVGAGLVLRPSDGGWDAALSEQRPAGVDVLIPPDTDAAVARVPSDVADRLLDDAPLHLARLEGWFVRHHDDLGAVRELLAALAERRGSWTADVSPWAWGWMRRLMPEASSLPAAWTPAALDDAALAGWLGGDARLRERRSGQPLDAAFFRALAARSGGQAGAARAIWRVCLENGAEAAEEAGVDDAGGGDDPAAVWVRAPADVDLPDGTALARTDLLLVHALLLHGPVRRGRLERSLVSIRPLVGPALHRLAASGLVQQDANDRWRPRPEAVPAIDARLAAEAFAGANA